MQAPNPLPPELGDIFRVADASALGVPKGRLRARDLIAPFWGVRAAAGPCDDDGTRDAEARRQVLRYVPRLAPDAFFTHRSAALLWRLPISVSADEVVHVGVPAPRRPPRGVGVRGHKVASQHVSVRMLDGVPVAGPASTWAQLGAMLDVRDLVAVGDAIVRVPRVTGGRPGHPSSALGTIAQLQAVIFAGRRVGINRLRAALPLIRAGAASRPETHVRLDLADAGLPEPELDVEVRDASGRLLGISEMVYSLWRVAVEYEGDHHRTDTQQWNRDIDKYRAYAEAGWTPVRVTAENLYGKGPRPAVLVRAALRRAGWTPSAG